MSCSIMQGGERKWNHTSFSYHILNELARLNELAVQKSTKEKRDSQIQAIWSESDQNIGRLRSKIGVLESNGDLLRTKLARMAKYLEDPV